MVSSVLAEVTEYKPTNTLFRWCGTVLDITTVKSIAVAATGVDCEFSTFNDTTDETARVDLSTAERVVGTAGQFCYTVTAAEYNITGQLRVYCTASNASTAAYEMIFTTRKSDIADNGIGPKSQTFDGQTLAESGSTLDLEASEISADSQFVGDRISLYNAGGAYYGSSCIVASTNANERVTTEDNLSALHTVGDFYVIKSDSACSITASKIATGALTNTKFAAGAIDASAVAAGALTNAKFAAGAISSTTLAADSVGSTQLATTAVDEIVAAVFAKVVNAVTALPTDGPETFEKIVRSVYQRFFHKVTDNTSQQERQIYQTGGVAKWCESPTTASGGIFTNGVCGAVD